MYGFSRTSCNTLVTTINSLRVSCKSTHVCKNLSLSIILQFSHSRCVISVMMCCVAVMMTD